MADSEPQPALQVEELREHGPEVVGSGPLVLELGFGRADLILALAQARPDHAFLGVEVSRKRVDKAVRRAVRLGIHNVKLVHSTAELVVERALPEACVHECWVNCPDPWPKKRHHRRRLLQTPFLERLSPLLARGACLHVSTDHEGYAQQIAGVLGGVGGLVNLHAPAAWSELPPERPTTAYEREWLAEGRRMAYFDYRRV